MAQTKARAPSCFCGCNKPVRFTRGHWSRFLPGHDARLVAHLLKAVRDGDTTIGEAVDFLNKELSPRLAHQLLRLYSTRPKTRTKVA
jgi:hypothetical protein